MLGAIAGDIIGSVHEWAGTKTKDFELFHRYARFTDDTVLTVAVADWILQGGDLVEILHAYVHRYPGAGYGGMFADWATARRRTPYNSFGNGAAMRISPVGFAFDDLHEVLQWAERATAVTHNHPEGIRGGQATAAAIFLARSGLGKSQIRQAIEARFGYDLSPRLCDIRPYYGFDETCRGSVPQAMIAFLESESYEDAVRNAISLGGDADTLACIAGGIAEAFYGGVPAHVAAPVRAKLDAAMWDVVERFQARFIRTPSGPASSIGSSGITPA